MGAKSLAYFSNTIFDINVFIGARSNIYLKTFYTVDGFILLYDCQRNIKILEMSLDDAHLSVVEGISYDFNIQMLKYCELIDSWEGRSPPIIWS